MPKFVCGCTGHSSYARCPEHDKLPVLERTRNPWMDEDTRAMFNRLIDHIIELEGRVAQLEGIGNAPDLGGTRANKETNT